MESVNMNEAINIAGGRTFFTKQFDEVYLLKGFGNIEKLIESHIITEPKGIISPMKNGIVFGAMVTGKLVWFGINKNQIEKIIYIGGKQIMVNPSNAITQGVTTGLLLGPVVGLLDGLLTNQNKNLILLEFKLSNESLVIGIPSVYIPLIEKMLKGYENLFDKSLLEEK